MSRHWMQMSKRCEVCRLLYERQPGETAGNFRNRRTCSRKCLCKLREGIQEKRFRAEPVERVCERCGRVFHSVNARRICSSRACLKLRIKEPKDWKPEIDMAFSEVIALSLLGKQKGFPLSKVVGRAIEIVAGTSRGPSPYSRMEAVA